VGGEGEAVCGAGAAVLVLRAEICDDVVLVSFNPFFFSFGERGVMSEEGLTDCTSDEGEAHSYFETGI